MTKRRLIVSLVSAVVAFLSYVAVGAFFKNDISWTEGAVFAVVFFVAFYISQSVVYRVRQRTKK